MKINLGYNGHIVYANLQIPDDYFNLSDTEKKIVLNFRAKELLDNLSSRNDLNIPLITAFNKIIDYSITKYEEKEKYEECSILLSIKKTVEIESRREFNEIVNEG